MSKFGKSCLLVASVACMVSPSLGDQDIVDTVTFSQPSAFGGKVFRITREISDDIVYVESPVTTNKNGDIKVGYCYSDKFEFMSRDLLKKESSDPCENGGGRHGPDSIWAGSIELIFESPDGTVDVGILKIAFQSDDVAAYNFIPSENGKLIDLTRLTRNESLNGKSIMTLNGDLATYHAGGMAGDSPYIAIEPMLFDYDSQPHNQF